MDKTKCEKCRKQMAEHEMVWLEHSMTNAKYYLSLPEGHESQGFFCFCGNCAEKEIIRDSIVAHIDGKDVDVRVIHHYGQDIAIYDSPHNGEPIMRINGNISHLDEVGFNFVGYTPNGRGAFRFVSVKFTYKK